MQIQTDKRSGRLVIEAENVSYSFGDQPIVREFSTIIQRGDKVGIIGPNGSGKTTLLRILMGELLPQQGSVRQGTNLAVAYFDQLRAQLDDSKSVMENVGQGGDTVTINGKTRNLVGYLEDFLFTRDRVQAPIGVLSGGERNRLLLARLFAQPANLLVMDEPTNDLDIETLEVLEDMLMDYSGTLLLVSHDRAFLNNLVTSTLAVDGDGQVREYIGGYDDWRQQKQAEVSKNVEQKSSKSAAQTQSGTSSIQRKPSYKEQRALEAQKRELDELPGRIEALEMEQHQLSADMANADFYQRNSTVIAQAINRLKEIEDELADAYQRWEELEHLSP
jgi:ATP-binding cassette subfamily F protein uup